MWNKATQLYKYQLLSMKKGSKRSQNYIRMCKRGYQMPDFLFSKKKIEPKKVDSKKCTFVSFISLFFYIKCKTTI